MKKRKSVTGWRKSGTFMREEYENIIKNKKNVRVKRAKKGSVNRKPGTFKNFTTLSGVNKGDKFISDQLYYIITQKTISEKKKIIRDSLLPNIEIFNIDDLTKRIVKDNLKYALQQKTVLSINNVLKSTINALNDTTLSGVKKYHKDTKSHNVNIKVVSGIDPNSFFDVSVIKDLDDLKKQYRQLALKYHPDRGGTNEQMQVINAEHERLRNLLLKGSTLTEEQKKNEVEIDNTFRVIIDEIIHIEGIEIELIGKWLWVGSNLNPERNWQFETPTYNALKSAGLDYIKKAGRPYMVYKGVESKGRGKMTKAEIEAKYGKHKFETKGRKRINSPFKINATRLKNAVKRLTKALDKRPV